MTPASLFDAAPALSIVPKRSLRALVAGVDAIADAIEQLDDETLTPELKDALSEQLIGALAGTRAKVDSTCRALALFESLEAGRRRSANGSKSGKRTTGGRPSGLPATSRP
jgi:hypothetical protein